MAGRALPERRPLSTRTLAFGLLSGASLIAVVLAVIWFTTQLARGKQGDLAFRAGVAIAEYADALVREKTPRPLPAGLTARSTTLERLTDARNRTIVRVPEVPANWHRTFLQVRSSGNGALRPAYVFRQGSPFLVSELDDVSESAFFLGEVSRRLAEDCADAALVLPISDGWMLFGGPGVWSCGAQPPDYRTVVVILGGFLVIGLWVAAAQISAPYEGLSESFGRRESIGDLSVLPDEGPVEARAIAQSANRMISAERQRRTDLMTFLSAISHDLGSPATRLRLRAERIVDEDLRRRMVGEIEWMNLIIAETLAFFEQEATSESPEVTDLSALAAACVDDYSDVGRPVSLEPLKPIEISAAASIFIPGREFTIRLDDERRIIARCRPGRVRRALQNLIDNALGYGGEATLGLDPSAEEVRLFVRDPGKGIAPEHQDGLMKPFKRGAHGVKEGAKGAGLGLTVVQAVADAHGGRVEMNQIPSGGFEVSIVIPRGL